MARDTVDLTPIESRDELVAWIEKGEKHGPVLKVGTEHEKFPFYSVDHTPVPYQGGIEAVLQGLKTSTGWEPIFDGAHIIGLADETGGGAISLEPGGQFELSGAPFASVHETKAELEAHFAALQAVSQPLGINYALLGMSPLWSRAQTPVMPKRRYAIMMGYMPKVGNLGLDMMLRTSTVQANLDFTSESDMAQKMRVSLSLQPIITALFANSPFTDGKLNGLQSMRSAIWLDTDQDRTGILPFAFDPGFGYESYVDYALDVPLYFVKRGETYHNVAGASFRDLMAGKLAALPGERAVLSDWVNHLGTIFPEVRLKRYLEMRGADVGSKEMILALPALSVGLLYDAAALDQAWQMVKDWTKDEREALRKAVPRDGLRATIAGRTVQDIAKDMLALARKGLVARGTGEEIYLAPLETIAAQGKNKSQEMIDAFNGPWAHSVVPAFAQTRMA